MRTVPISSATFTKSKNNIRSRSNIFEQVQRLVVISHKFDKAYVISKLFTCLIVFTYFFCISNGLNQDLFFIFQLKDTLVTTKSCTKQFHYH